MWATGTPVVHTEGVSAGERWSTAEPEGLSTGGAGGQGGCPRRADRSATLDEHIELARANQPQSLYPCGFGPFWGVILTSQVGEMERTGERSLLHTV